MFIDVCMFQFVDLQNLRKGELVIRNCILVSSINATSTLHPYLLTHNYTRSMVQNRTCSLRCGLYESGSNPDWGKDCSYLKNFQESSGVLPRG
jgi:hypothetical protein